MQSLPSSNNSALPVGSDQTDDGSLGSLSAVLSPPTASSSAGASPHEGSAWSVSVTAATAMALYRPRTLKCRDTFLVLDHFGDAQATGVAAEGLFHKDTRYLSRSVLRINGLRPLLLSSSVSQDNIILSVNLTNPDIVLQNGNQLIREVIHINREMVLGPGILHERLTVTNYDKEPVQLHLSVEHSADFVDIFEVRGQTREKRGKSYLPEVHANRELLLRYLGLDSVERRSRVRFDIAPDDHDGQVATWHLSLSSNEHQTIGISVACNNSSNQEPHPRTFHILKKQLRGWSANRSAQRAVVHTSNTAFNDWLHRSQADLAMLTTDTPYGPLPYAGIPWFSCPFGRNSLITALQCLWIDPELAKGTLLFLAETQAQEFEPSRDAEPGKILHEMRNGEMAALNEVPFGRYYGSVNSTPLFVVLATRYFKRTGDLALVRRLWPAIEKALHWMATYGDPDGDGLIEYGRKSQNGLVNQGWKDSHDSIFHADGNIAKPPIALIEVQAYAEAAWRGASELARSLAKEEPARTFEAKATLIRQKVIEAFWCEDLETYAIALDKDKRPCCVRNSNVGHALFTGLVSPDQASRIAKTLFLPTSFCGWGIRTIAEGESRYNPMSYHNGSVWPHDNGLIAMGLKKYELHSHLKKLTTGLFECALAIDMKRLPELYCGFPRKNGESPISYPVACLPQAWSAASTFAVIGAISGVSFHPQERAIRFVRPVLPSWLEEIRIENLRLHDTSVDITLRRRSEADDVSLSLNDRNGNVEVSLTV